MTQVVLVACLVSCLPTSLALSDSHRYLPWLGYQTASAYRFPSYSLYPQYQQYQDYPQYSGYYPHTYNNYHDRRLRQHQGAAVSVLPEVTLESSQGSGLEPPPPPPAPQPVFSPSSDLLLPVISPIQVS